MKIFSLILTSKLSKHVLQQLECRLLGIDIFKQNTPGITSKDLLNHWSNMFPKLKYIVMYNLPLCSIVTTTEIGRQKETEKNRQIMNFTYKQTPPPKKCWYSIKNFTRWKKVISLPIFTKVIDYQKLAWNIFPYDTFYWWKK